MLPGLGYFLSTLILIGGVAFNIGNIAGCGLGFNVMFGMDVITGAIISSIIAIVIFMIKEFRVIMDWFARILGFVMIALTLYIAIIANPPWTEIVTKTFVPDTINWRIIITLVGGTVGGYISFAGGHRLLDAGIKGQDKLPDVSRSAVTGIAVASLMRFLLFFAVLGVVVNGFTPDPSNPPASVFKEAAGQLGYRIFGLVMWAAAITSVIGSAFTSVSFIKTFHEKIKRSEKLIIILFIVFSLIIFIIVGNPVQVLVAVGALNGFILPIALVVMLVAAYQKKLVGAYKHPVVLLVFGILVALATSAMSLYTLIKDWNKLFAF
jgi:Mn2+/Fe2+ NRAMP family transporter